MSEKKYASGGFIPGTGEGVKAKLHGCTLHGKPHPKRLIRDADGKIECNGEWVINARAVHDIGLGDTLDRINRGEAV